MVFLCLSDGPGPKGAVASVYNYKHNYNPLETESMLEKEMKCLNNQIVAH